MSVAMVVQDAIRAGSLCSTRHSAAGLTRDAWIAGGIKLSLLHARSVAFVGDPIGFISHVHGYVSALKSTGEAGAAAIVADNFECKEE